MKIIVSACLLGKNCKYNGKNNLSQKVLDFIRGHDVIPVCPETAGGLPTPRPPAEIQNGRVVNSLGKDVDANFRAGALLCLNSAGDDVDLAILQPRSPSCGVGTVYDGTFSGTLISGDGVFAQMLKDKNIKVITPEDL